MISENEKHVFTTDQILTWLRKRLAARGQKISSKDYESLACLYPEYSDYFSTLAGVQRFTESIAAAKAKAETNKEAISDKEENG
jgi:hypothetical protein